MRIESKEGRNMRLMCGKRHTVRREGVLQECGNGKAKGDGRIEGRQGLTREREGEIDK